MPASADVDRQALRRLREAKGWDQARLAEKAGLSRPYVNQIESGARRPSPPALQALARALDVNIAVLMPRNLPIVCPNCGHVIDEKLAR